MRGSHVCSTADGQFSIDFGDGDGELVEKEHNGAVAYTTLGKTLLDRSSSICRSQTAPGVEYDIIDERYVLRIRPMKGDAGDQSLICEHYWDASPGNACSGRESDTLKERTVRPTKAICAKQSQSLSGFTMVRPCRWKLTAPRDASTT